MEPSHPKPDPWTRWVLPRIVHFTCSRRPNTRQREKIVPLARGEVLEVGFGSGLNLPHYDAARVAKVWGLDPSTGMSRLAATAVESAAVEVELVDAPADAVPLPDASVDTIVITYTLCTIPTTEPALREMARVLRPGGTLLFCEHGAAPDAGVRRWQDRLDPLWQRVGGGCHLNREIPRLIEDGGFSIEDLQTMYIPGWRPASFNYWGTAAPV